MALTIEEALDSVLGDERLAALAAAAVRLHVAVVVERQEGIGRAQAEAWVAEFGLG